MMHTRRPELTPRTDAPRPRRDNTARLGRDARGATLIEYIILVALVTVAMVVILLALGPSVIAEYSARRATLYSHAP